MESIQQILFTIPEFFWNSTNSLLQTLEPLYETWQTLGIWKWALVIILGGLLLLSLKKRFKHWVFCKSGFAEAKTVETLNNHKFAKYEGFLFVSERTALFRLDCCDEKTFLDKKESLRQNIIKENPGIVGINSELDKALFPVLLTHKEAQQYQLDLDEARTAALTWWKTGYFKLKPSLIMNTPNN